MRKISVFNFLTVNGYYKGLNEDVSWHRHGEEEAEFTKEGTQSGSVLLFGRKTYEMMAGYWPSPAAMEQSPGVADGMNRSEKIVFSNTLSTASWQNTRIISGDIVTATKQLKNDLGPEITILGSGSIVSQLSDEVGLIDEYQLMIDPVALGEGTPIFQGMKNKLPLELVSSRVFTSGVVLLTYRLLQ